MRNLYITTMAGHPWGGSEELWVKLALDDLKKGKNVHCSIFNWGDLPKKIELLGHAGAKIHKRNRFQYPELFKKPWGKFVEKTFSLKQLKKQTNQASPDQVIISMGGFCDLEVNPYRQYLLQLNKPFELIIHVNPENYYLQNSKIGEIIRVCEKARKVWFVSHRLMEIAIRQTGYSFPNGDIIRNPVNMHETGILPWPTGETMQLACVGRLDAPVKGHPVLFQALSQSQWAKRDWHLNIYGTGPDEAYYKHLVEAFGIGKKVTLHGFTNDIRNDIWANNHILVMPSYFEGLPIALVEAMLCGRPAVVTDVGGNAEILDNNETGFIAEGVHLSSFSNAMERAWERKEEWKEMGEKCNAKASKYISKEV
jgi:glycosyltransferase involved in cell wall biosynthesis